MHALATLRSALGNGREVAVGTSECCCLSRRPAVQTIQGADSYHRPGKRSLEGHNGESVERPLHRRAGTRPPSSERLWLWVGRMWTWNNAAFGCDVAYSGSTAHSSFIETKSDHSNRSLRLPDVCVSSLLRHAAFQSEERMLAGSKWTESGLCFTSRFGTPLDGPNVTHQFQKLLLILGPTEDEISRFAALRRCSADFSGSPPENGNGNSRPQSDCNHDELVRSRFARASR